jgi:large subunit ribosomal protein L6
MSRIGKKPVAIPSGVEVTLVRDIITVKGPKGALSFTHHHDVAVKKTDAEVTVEVVGTSKKAAGIWGTTVILLSNMIEGVTQGFEKKLELNGVGYRMAVQGNKINLALGFSHPVEMAIPAGIEAKVENNVLSIAGIDKHQVGQFAAIIRDLKPVEPYKGKGFRYAGELVRRKEGKKTTT